MNKCEKCGVDVPIEEAFTICHGSLRKWNMAWLCEACVDALLAEQTAAKIAESGK